MLIYNCNLLTIYPLSYFTHRHYFSHVEYILLVLNLLAQTLHSIPQIHHSVISTSTRNVFLIASSLFLVNKRSIFVDHLYQNVMRQRLINMYKGKTEKYKSIGQNKDIVQILTCGQVRTAKIPTTTNAQGSMSRIPLGSCYLLT